MTMRLAQDGQGYDSKQDVIFTPKRGLITSTEVLTTCTTKEKNEEVLERDKITFNCK